MVTQTPELGQVRKHWKERYPVKLAKYHIYKRFTGSEDWLTRFAFEKALRSIRPGDITIDCGANIGEVSHQFAIRGAMVHAFEPDPWAFSYLSNRFSQQANVSCHAAAVGATQSDLILYRRPDFDADPAERSTGSSLYRAKSNVDPNAGIRVQQSDLNSFIRGLQRRVRVLKIDIEGAEVPLLESMLEEKTIDLCDVVFVETHETRIPELVDRTEALRVRFNQDPYRSRVFLGWI
jgi:FkbM family methyltransferase